MDMERDQLPTAQRRTRIYHSRSAPRAVRTEFGTRHLHHARRSFQPQSMTTRGDVVCFDFVAPNSTTRQTGHCQWKGMSN
jgi:hypothetical protein